MAAGGVGDLERADRLVAADHLPDHVFSINQSINSRELFQLQVAPLVLKFGIHQGQTWRKGVRGGEEEGKSGRIESECVVRDFNT
jgi:hypothetical protein